MEMSSLYVVIASVCSSLVVLSLAVASVAIIARKKVRKRQNNGNSNNNNNNSTGIQFENEEEEEKEDAGNLSKSPELDRMNSFAISSASINSCREQKLCAESLERLNKLFSAAQA